jgi:hypothetical protein
MLAKTLSLAAAALACGGALVAAGDDYKVTIQNGNFTVDTVIMHAPATNDTWKERAVATVVMTGASEKIVDAGTLQFQVYEHGVPSFISSGSFACVSVLVSVSVSMSCVRAGRAQLRRGRCDACRGSPRAVPSAPAALQSWKVFCEKGIAESVLLCGLTIRTSTACA